jgi:hypothetical protein
VGTSLSTGGQIKAGSYQQRVSAIGGTDAGNYSLSSYTTPTATYTVNQLSITLAGQATTSTYNGQSQSNGFVAMSGMLYTGDITTVTGLATGTNAGTYSGAVQLSNAQGPGVGNYQITYGSGGSLTITAASLHLLNITGSRIYNGATLFTYQDFQLTGAANGETVTLISGSAYTPSANAGTYLSRPLLGLSILVVGGSADNYVLPATATLTITPKSLTIAALNDTKIYDNVPYAGGKGVTYSGWVPGESETVLSGALTYAGSSQGALSAGAYSIKPQGLSSVNYNITYADGQLTISPVPVVAPAITPIAMATPSTGGASTGGAFTGGTSTGLSGNLTSPATASAPASSVSSTSAALSSNSNSTASASPTAPASTTAAPASATVTTPSSSPAVEVLKITALPRENVIGIATLQISQPLPPVGQQLQVAMPKEITQSGVPTVNTSSLPSWLNYDAAQQVFVVRSTPAGVDTVQVTIRVSDRTWNLTLEFKNN